MVGLTGKLLSVLEMESLLHTLDAANVLASVVFSNFFGLKLDMQTCANRYSRASYFMLQPCQPIWSLHKILK